MILKIGTKHGFRYCDELDAVHVKQGYKIVDRGKETMHFFDENTGDKVGMWDVCLDTEDPKKVFVVVSARQRSTGAHKTFIFDTGGYLMADNGETIQHL
jgi:hypothetical protein